MSKKGATGYPASLGKMGCCKVESLVSVDERGQMVLPKALREKAKIRAGDKLALVSCGNERAASCIFLIKAEALTGLLKDVLGPLTKEMSKR